MKAHSFTDRELAKSLRDLIAELRRGFREQAKIHNRQIAGACQEIARLRAKILIAKRLVESCTPLGLPDEETIRYGVRFPDKIILEHTREALKDIK